MALPLSVQNTYQDLVAAHLQCAVAEIPGTPFRREVAGRGYWYVIPACTDQNPCAHSRMPIEMIFHGRSISLFQASQQSATMSS